MAMMNCQECGHQVSTKAVACPGCGAPVVIPTLNTTDAVWRTRSTWAIGLFLLLAALAGLFELGHTANDEADGRAGQTHRSPGDVDPASLDPAEIGAQIEPDASIGPAELMTPARLSQMVTIVRSNGYRCDSISSAGESGIFDLGLRLRCNRWRYSYDMHDRGGHWVVTVE